MMKTKTGLMASNIKPKASAKESPTEPFKRALGGCLRAIAREGEEDERG